MKRRISRVASNWFVIFALAGIGFGPLGSACPLVAQRVPARFAVEASQVAAAMREGQLPVEGVQLQLAAPVTASAAAVRIEVESVLSVSPHQVRLRLACVDRSECLPFFATATYPDAVDVGKLVSTRDAKPAPNRKPEFQSSVAMDDAGRFVKVAAMRDGVMLRAGTKATLQFEADKIHVRIEVISLQNGAPGSRIRVSSVDHKQIYTAEVVTPALLKGELSK